MAPSFETMIACPSCGCHARGNESHCPECGAPLRRADGSVPRTAVAALMGLTAALVTPASIVAGCDGDSTTSTTAGDGGTGGAGMGGAGGMGGMEAGVTSAYGAAPSSGSGM